MAAAQAAGVQIRGISEEDPFVALAVLPMGWSWAPFIAQTLLCDIVEGAAPELGPASRVAEGLPCPQLGALAAIHLEFIGDVGVGGLVDKDAEPTTLLALRDSLRQALGELGVELHKEEMGTKGSIRVWAWGPTRAP